MFPLFSCPPSVCAEVASAAHTKLVEAELDGVVSRRFEPPAAAHANVSSSRMLRQLAELRALTGEKDPFEAMSVAMREGACRHAACPLTCPA